MQVPDVAKQRQLTVLRLMREAGYISQAESDAIAAEPLRYRSRLFDIDAPHFVMYVQDLLTQRLGADRLRAGGLRVVTTLDRDLQRQAKAAVRYRLDQLNCRVPGVCDQLTDPDRRVDNAAAVILDSHSGDILAMVGSPDYFDERIQGNVNAALALRQPGSAIKPFTYAAALDPQWSRARGQQPLTPATIIADLPITFHIAEYDEMGHRIGNVPYTPLNYDRSYHGPVSVRAALANSYNIPAVKVLDHIGVETLRQIASRAGISTFTKRYGLALTLGGGEVRLLDLATAFGIFQDGHRLESRAILTVEQAATPQSHHTESTNGAERPHSEQPINQWRRAPAQRTTSLQSPVSSPRPQIIASETAHLITDILSDNEARIPAFGENSVLRLPFTAAAKTGTTTDWRDNWTVGYSTERIVAVWVGNADNTPMLGVSGIDGAGPIWRDLMLASHADPPAPFRSPEGIREITICAPSGLLPSEACPRTRRERFIAGAEPTQPDDQFQHIVIDRQTGQRASADTPPTRTVERVYWMLPPAYHDWMLAQGIAIAPPPLAEQDASIASHQSPVSNPQSLVLTAPTSNTAFQIHPGVPDERQRIELAGYAADGRAWAELRLMKDGEPLAMEHDAVRLRDWWVLEPGQHQFWLEGRRSAEDDWERSEAALVMVTTFTRTQNSNERR